MRAFRILVPLLAVACGGRTGFEPADDGTIGLAGSAQSSDGGAEGDPASTGGRWRSDLSSGGSSAQGGSPAAAGGAREAGGSSTSGANTGGSNTGGRSGSGSGGLPVTGGAGGSGGLPGGNNAGGATSGGGTGGEVGRPVIALYEPEDTPLGRTHAQWLAKFWQWSLAIPKGLHPREGGSCSEGQDPTGPAWFLTTGQNGYPQQRTCEIPAGRTVVVLLNATLMYPRPDCEPCQTSTMEEWFERADEFFAPSEANLEANKTFLEIDGWAYDVDEDYFLTRGDFFPAAVDPDKAYFDCTGPIGVNGCGWETGTERPFRSSGYIVVLEDLPPGPHTLRYGSDSPPYSPSPWHTDVTYHIEVK